MTDLPSNSTEPVGADIRVRFCPSPTGNPHVGMVRTALFNWAFARHTGGTFVFRIEDTDSARDSEQSYQDLLGALSWLGMDWDEGPEVGGPHAPYRQSQRMEFYVEAARKLLEGGYAYRCFCTNEELAERREAAKAAGRAPGYDGQCRNLTAEQVCAYEEQGRASVVRLRMPDGPMAWDDLVRGPLSFDVFRAGPGSEQLIPDFVIVRGNGEPLYTLVNPVDDAMMGITHVLRGEDLLSSTPRQLAMWRALADLGIAAGPLPRFGHLPYVMGEGNRKLSKRDIESSLNLYREEGFLPEGFLNYLALLGWSLPRGYPLPQNPPPSALPAEDSQAEPILDRERERDVFSVAELVAAFGMTEDNARVLSSGTDEEVAAALADPRADLSRVNPNPARFDLKKCKAINAEHIRWMADEDLARAMLPVLSARGLITDPPAPEQVDVVAAAVPLVKERMQTLAEGADLLRFLFADESDFEVVDVGQINSEPAQLTLTAAVEALEPVADWTVEAIEGALRTALIDGLGLKPRKAFTPIRVAVTGRRVSPPLFESMELLGKRTCLARLAAATAAR